MTALVISTLVGPRMIRWLQEMQIGQAVRVDGPQSHLSKAGTPTMGGALIIVAIASAPCCGVIYKQVPLGGSLTTVLFGAIGWVTIIER